MSGPRSPGRAAHAVPDWAWLLLLALPPSLLLARGRLPARGPRRRKVAEPARNDLRSAEAALDQLVRTLAPDPDRRFGPALASAVRAAGADAELAAPGERGAGAPAGPALWPEAGERRRRRARRRGAGRRAPTRRLDPSAAHAERPAGIARPGSGLTRVRPESGGGAALRSGSAPGGGGRVCPARGGGAGGRGALVQPRRRVLPAGGAGTSGGRLAPRAATGSAPGLGQARPGADAATRRRVRTVDMVAPGHPGGAAAPRRHGVDRGMARVGASARGFATAGSS